MRLVRQWISAVQVTSRQGVLAFGLLAASLVPAWAEPAGDWQDLPSQTEILTAEGIAYKVIYDPSLRVTPLADNRNRVEASAQGNLTDLQAKLPDIARTALEKRNRSATIKLTLLDMQALRIAEPDVYVTGTVRAEMPLPGAGVNIPGLISVPEKLDQTFDIELRLYPDVTNKSLALGTELVSLTPHSQQLAALGLGGNATQMVGQALLSALQADKLALNLPDGYEQFAPKINNAAFVDLGNDTLGVDASAEATLTDAELAKLRQTLNQKS